MARRSAARRLTAATRVGVGRTDAAFGRIHQHERSTARAASVGHCRGSPLAPPRGPCGPARRRCPQGSLHCRRLRTSTRRGGSVKSNAMRCVRRVAAPRGEVKTARRSRRERGAAAGRRVPLETHPPIEPAAVAGERHRALVHDAIEGPVAVGDARSFKRSASLRAWPVTSTGPATMTAGPAVQPRRGEEATARASAIVTVECDAVVRRHVPQLSRLVAGSPTVDDDEVAAGGQFKRQAARVRSWLSAMAAEDRRPSAMQTSLPALVARMRGMATGRPGRRRRQARWPADRARSGPSLECAKAPSHGGRTAAWHHAVDGVWEASGGGSCARRNLPKRQEIEQQLDQRIGLRLMWPPSGRIWRCSSGRGGGPPASTAASVRHAERCVVQRNQPLQAWQAVRQAGYPSRSLYVLAASKAARKRR